MTTAMDRWKASLEGQAYNQEVYVVAIHVLINFMEKRPQNWMSLSFMKTLSHYEAILDDMNGTVFSGAHEDGKAVSEQDNQPISQDGDNASLPIQGA